MKKLQFLVCMFCLAILSCNESDEKNYNALEGEWNLIKISGGFSPENLDIPEGLITYDFNTQQNKVTIHNNSELLYPVSGVYPYTVDLAPDSGMCTKTITINNEGDYCFLLDGDTMSFDLSPVDGLRLDLKR